MSKGSKSIESLDLTEQTESVIEPVLNIKTPINNGMIGLLMKGSNSLIQIHSSMRRHYEGKEQWTIIEPDKKK